MSAKPPHNLDPFVTSVGATVDRHAMIAPGAGVVVAVSGGADSVALLLALADLAGRDHRRYRLHVAHVDHALREESAADGRFVAELAERLSLPATIERIDVAAAAANGEGHEEAGRRIRYAFLTETAHQAGCSCIATGHHSDDNVETVLHRIVRGTGIEGMAGIRYRRTISDDNQLHVVRPLLDVSRSDAEAFVTARGHRWRTDPTNLQSQYTRNRIRNELLPMLRRDYNPKVDAAVTRLIQASRWAEESMQHLSAEDLKRILLDESDNRIVLAVADLDALGPGRASLAIRAALRRAGAPMGRIGLDAIGRVLDLIAQPAGTGRLELADGVRISREYQQLIVQTGGQVDPPRPTGQACSVDWPGRTALPDGSVLDVTLSKAGPSDLGTLFAGKDSYTEWLDAEQIAPPLRVRRWCDGDLFRPLGSPGRQKLSDFFGSAQIPAAARRDTWVLADARGIIWVAPHRIDHRVRLTETTSQVATIQLTAPERPRQ